MNKSIIGVALLLSVLGLTCSGAVLKQLTINNGPNMPLITNDPFVEMDIDDFNNDLEEYHHLVVYIYSPTWYVTPSLYSIWNLIFITLVLIV